MQVNFDNNKVNFQAYTKPSAKVQNYFDKALGQLSSNPKRKLYELISDSFEKQKSNKIPIELDVKNDVLIAKVNNKYEFDAVTQPVAGFRGFIAGRREYMLNHPAEQIKQVLKSANTSADALS